jgi:hypothetical protein
MSKDMNVTIWPLWDNGFGDFYADTPSRRMPTRVDFAVYAKRLTDTELAAEWQQAKRHEAVAVITGKPYATIEIRRMQTIDRFAKLPHHDEPRS